MSYPLQDVVVNCSTTDSCVGFICLLPFVDSLGKTFVKKLLLKAVKDTSDFELTKEHLGGPPPALKSS